MKNKTSTPVGLRVPDDILIRIDAVARRDYSTRSRVIVMALRQLYGEDRPKQEKRAAR